ncbi:Hypothetical predicted protein [Podarcis lilfordi]|uniref:Uncharacterized protein n=1 Tax=Podarcis lilfordi TaxID=74358 RepID=A0AA35KUT2_9SAUR|nr:Hypothetical predicted protein [Podarcis lilfordi]
MAESRFERNGFGSRRWRVRGGDARGRPGESRGGGGRLIRRVQRSHQGKHRHENKALQSFLNSGDLRSLTCYPSIY